jgi:hypothetical protein
MNKLILAVLAAVMIMVPMGVGAMGGGEERPKTVCGMLQDLIARFDNLESSVVNKLDKIDSRLNGLEKEVTDLKNTVGSFDTIPSSSKVENHGASSMSESDPSKSHQPYMPLCFDSMPKQWDPRLDHKSAMMLRDLDVIYPFTNFFGIQGIDTRSPSVGNAASIVVHFKKNHGYTLPKALTEELIEKGFSR